jgi:hypothetical protein
MESNWAAEHLQVIRTLMERTAVYRRALAPVALMIGILGILAGLIGWIWGLNSSRAFGLFWLLVSLVGLGLALLMVRRQALKAAEPFWSPPMRRVTQAMLPALVAGLASVLLLVAPSWRDPLQAWWLPAAWMVWYGCALHAAGFFMPRGIRLLGWLFILAGCGLAGLLTCYEGVPPLRLAHGVMGGVFGGLHLAYGIYLYVTERAQERA